MKHRRPVDEVVDDENDGIKQYYYHAEYEICRTEIFPGQQIVTLGSRFRKLVPKSIAKPKVEKGNPTDYGG